MGDDKNPYGVEVGQVWATNDYRYRGRVFRVLDVVLDVDEPYARTEAIADHKPAYAAKIGRRGKILLRKFQAGHLGYRRIK